MTIVGRTGHMDGEKYVEDTVTVRVEMPGGWAVYANDKTEKLAQELGKKEIEKAKAQMREQIRQRVATGAISEDLAKHFLKEADL